jgi:hypothetical protein
MWNGVGAQYEDNEAGELLESPRNPIPELNNRNKHTRVGSGPNRFATANGTEKT